MPINKVRFANVSEVDEKLLKRFRCKEESLAAFLSSCAVNYNNAGAGNTTVLLDIEKDRIIGYYTLKCSYVKVHDKEMSDYPRFIPAIEIARFAIDNRYEKKGFGKGLFSWVLERISDIITNHVGAQFMILFSLPTVTEFYRKFDFKELDSTMAMYECKENEGCICMYSTINKMQQANTQPSTSLAEAVNT